MYFVNQSLQRANLRSADGHRIYQVYCILYQYSPGYGTEHMALLLHGLVRFLRAEKVLEVRRVRHSSYPKLPLLPNVGPHCIPT